MSIVLLIDDIDDISPVLQGALEGCDLSVKAVQSSQDAKMTLLEFTPQLIFTRMSLAGENRAGLKFCQELRDHHSFSEIPVVLFVDDVTDEVKEASKHFGAKGVFPFPVEKKELRKLLSPMVPQLASEQSETDEKKLVQSKVSGASSDKPVKLEKSETKAGGDKKKIESKTKRSKTTSIVKESKSSEKTSVSAHSEKSKKDQAAKNLSGEAKRDKSKSKTSKEVKKTDSRKKDLDSVAKKDLASKEKKSGEAHENLLFAQRILATILHNLKTSDLLQVVEKEDVSRIVYEMTKSVCGIRDEIPAESDEPDEELSNMSSDLDRAFGLSSGES